MIATLMLADSQSKLPEDLLNAAARIEDTNPAFASVALHRSRLWHVAGSTDEARSILQDALSRPKQLPPSSRNMFLLDRATLAQSLDEFLAYSARTPIGIGSGYAFEDIDLDSGCTGEDCDPVFFNRPVSGKPSLLPQFGLESAKIINTALPLSDLVHATKAPTLPPNLRTRIALSAWTRALLLEDDKVAATLVPYVLQAEPTIKPYIESYGKAPDANARRFAAAFALLHFPGLRPSIAADFPRSTPAAQTDVYRDNWWCDAGASPGSRFSNEPIGSTDVKVPSIPTFIKPTQREKAREQFATLHEIGSATRYLPKVALGWAKQHPEDPRVPEALHLSVRAVHLGCGDDLPNTLGRDAFLLLHKRYPNSQWAKRTRYWYD